MAPRKAILLLSACYVLVTAMRLAVPVDIDNKEQYLQGLYVIDILQKGSLFLPTAGGQLATKPPLYTWTAALFSLIWGHVNDFVIALPSVVAGLGVVYLTFLLAETLFSAEVGLLSGLILALSYHFTDLSCTARTDMMLCFFTTLSLFCFIRFYRDGNPKSIHVFLFFISAGLGSLAKGPVGLLIPLLVVFILLFLRRDLGRLKSIRWGLGVAASAAMVLTWFIPAVVIGGRKYYDFVFRHEMVDYYLGIGYRPKPLRPYFLLAHFFEKYLPWSLFVPSAIGHYWKSKNRSEHYGPLFLVIWILSVLVFFSLSRGKRPDYLLPLYPAASIIVGRFWESLIRTRETRLWTNQARVLSGAFFILCLLLPIGLTVFLMRPELAKTVVHLFPASSEVLELIYVSMSRNTPLYSWIALVLAGAAVFGLMRLRRVRLKILFNILLVSSFSLMALYFVFLSEDAGTLSGRYKKAFCSKVGKRIHSLDTLQFCNVDGSMLLYMNRNAQPLRQKEVPEFFRDHRDVYLITNERTYRNLQSGGGMNFVVLEESEFLRSEKTRYLLISKK